MLANRKNPGVHHTARQSRDREGALPVSAAGMRSLTVAARIGVSRPSTMSRARLCPAEPAYSGRLCSSTNSQSPRPHKLGHGGNSCSSRKRCGVLQTLHQ